MKDATEVLAAALEEATGRRPTTERHCHPTRKWRSDLAYEEQKLAIELDGRFHLRATRHRNDCEKRNWLIEQGWQVLTYPTGAILTKKRLPRIVAQVQRCLVKDSDAAAAACILTGD